MNFGQLHERVRLELVRRISKGTMSVSLLARQTGLGQPHVSNFAHGKRQLSLGALDRVMDAMRLRAEDLFPRPRGDRAEKEDRVEKVPVVAANVAMYDAFIRMSSVLWELSIARGLLGDGEVRCSSFRRGWDRYVAVQVGADEVRGMAPVVTAGAVVVLDRQYLSFDVVREGETNLYAVRREVQRRDMPPKRDAQMAIRYGKGLGGLVVLLSYAGNLEAEVLEVDGESGVEEWLVGRVAVVVNGS